MQLIDDGAIHRIQSSLAHARQTRTSWGAFWFNVAMLVIVVSIAIAFLIAQYHSTKHVIQPVNIPKTEVNWNNPVRNAIEEQL